MITNNGKLHIKRYLAQYVPTIADTIVFGVGPAAENVADARLQFESFRAPINLITYDFPNNRVVYKASIPEEIVGKINEVGIVYTSGNDFTNSSRLIVDFNDVYESWTTPAGTGINTDSGIAFGTEGRLGAETLRHSTVASGVVVSTMDFANLDFSGNSGDDVFKFAVNVIHPNGASVRYRFYDSTLSNYFEFNFTTPVTTSGYKVLEMRKGDAVTSGPANWADIKRIEITSTARSSGPSRMEHDGVRIDSPNAETLISRKVLGTPLSTADGMAQDVEFPLVITV